MIIGGRDQFINHVEFNKFTGHRTLVTGHWKLDTGHWTLDTGHWTLDTGNWTLDTGHWTLDTGHWSLDTGQWTLDTGVWTVIVPCVNVGNSMQFMKINLLEVLHIACNHNLSLI